MKLNKWLAAIAGLAMAVSNAQANDSTLPQGVRHILELRDLPESSLSLQVSDLETGEVVLDWNADTARNPASTMKLVTTLIALDVLGPSYRWYTDIYAQGEIADGRLDGDLLIKGHGDPFLVTDRVWQMLRDLRRLGVRDITGDLLIDDSYFRPARHDPAAFDNQPLRAYNVGPSALLTNLKVVRYWLSPAAPGVNVILEPPLPNLIVINKLALAAARCGGYQRGVSIHANESVDVISLEGQFPDRCRRYAMDRTALSHNEYTYGLVRSLWEESGGTLQGEMGTGIAPQEERPLLSFPSLPLGEVITRINKFSNNVMARQLVYTLAAEERSVPATLADGRAVIAEWVEENLPSVDSLVFDNGSGLSRDARINAADFVTLLRFAWQQTYMPEFAASMAISGQDGTLRKRFDDHRLSGRAHLKTGSLDHVAAIAGYMQSASGRRFAVVALQNHTDVHRGPGEEVQTALLRWLYEQ